MNMAEELVAQGGPSAPVWAFLTTITLAVIAGLFQTVKAKREAREARLEAQKAVRNTTSISNGFASGVDTHLKRIIKTQDRMEVKQDDTAKALREHLVWHLDKETQK